MDAPGSSWFDLGEIVLGGGLAAAGVGLARYRRSLRRARADGESRFRSLVEAAPFGVVVHRGDDVLYVNRRGRLLFGPGDGSHPSAAQLRELLAGGKGDPGHAEAGPARIRDADGRAVDARVLTIPTTFDGAPALLTFVRDVTAELAAERELAANRERLAAALEAARDGVWDLDLGSGTLSASPAFAGIIGGQAGAPRDAQQWLALVHPEDRRHLVSARTAGATSAEGRYECEVRVARREGGWTWVLEHGRVALRDPAGRALRLTGTVRDVTLRKRAEQRLEVRGRLAAAFLAARGEDLRAELGLLLQRVLDARCACVGLFDAAGSLRLTSNLSTPAADPPVHAVLPPDGFPDWLQELLAAGEPLVTTGPCPVGPDGPQTSLLGARLSGGPRTLGVVAVGGRPDGYRPEDLETLAGIVADLAPLVQSYLDAEDKDARLAQSRKMEALGVLAGGIAHDFNNILQAILGFSTLARQDAHDPARLAADLDRVQRATVRGRDLVQRILLFSRPGEPEAPPLDPLPLLEEIALELRTTQEPRIRVETRLAADCGHVRATTAQLRQALVNLATNATQAMQANGGSLTLAGRPLQVTPGDRRFPADWCGREVVEFTIADTGPGIPERFRARLFDPFFTTREVGQGTGLGLSVVHGLVSGLGGLVLIECPPGGGTVASVFLPRVDAQGHAAMPLDTPARPPVLAGGRRGRILFVDDDPEIRDLAAALLGRAGFEVETLPDGLSAYERLAAGPKGIDVVVTDQYMPGLTGRELALRVAALRPGLPVILVSGLDEPTDAAVSGNLVFREVVTKPFFGQSLTLAVTRAIGDDRASGNAP